MVYIYIHVSSHLHYFLGVYLSTFVNTQFVSVIDICHETGSLFCGHNIFHRNYSWFKILQPSYLEPPIL